jgi:hypothetical protein
MLLRFTILACLLTASVVLGQVSQFTFDPTGDLLAETSETGALPQIIGQPQMQVVIPGESASFSVVLADTSGVSYQWYFDTSAVPGANSDSLLITNVGTNNQGFYWAVVSNAFGSTASGLANLYIDSRGGGLPDSWQLQYFGNLNQNALGDYDGAGDSNLQDFLDGTNPTNAASALYRITLLNDGGTVVISPNQSAYTNGQVVTLTATGSSSAPFHAWTGDVVTRSNSVTVAMTTNRTLFAHFLPFTLLWTNILSGDWNVAANWSPNLTPGSNESVVITTYATITENSNVDLVDFTLGNSVSAPVLTGSGTVSIAGIGIWYAGTMSGSGTTVVQSNASLTLTSSGLVLRTLENAGSVVCVGGDFSLEGVITNDAGAQFTLLGPASIFGAGGFDNVGTLTLANGATTFGVAFNDYGTVNFPGGTLTLFGGGILANSLSVPTGSTLNLGGGAFTSSSNLSITGGGTLLASSATATLGGVVNVTGSNIFSGGSTELNGYYVCTNNALTISGGTVNFDGTGLVSPSVISLSGGSLGGSNTVTAGSAMSWTGGTMSGTGRTFIPQGVTLTISNQSPIFITSRTLDNGGTTTWSGANIDMNGGVITNESGALFQVQSPTSIFPGGGSPRFDNAGTLNTPASGTTTFDVAFNNFHTVGIQGGTLLLEGGGVNTGSISVPTGAAINLSGLTFTSSSGSTITGGGTLIVSGGTPTLSGVVNVTGSNIFSNGLTELNGYYVCTNNALTIAGGTVNFDGSGPVSPSVINLSNGSLGGSNLVTIGSAMTWTGGGMSGTGRTLVPPGATLSINNPSFITLTSRTLDNGGTTTWSGANIDMNGGVITNEPGALFQVQSPTSIFPGGGSPRFDNAGTLNTPASGTTTFDVAFNNFHTVGIQGGTLLLEGGGVNTGSISVPAGAAINLSGLAFTSSSGSTITGGGTLIVSGGTPTLSGVVNVTGSNIFSNGLTELNGDYVCTNNALTVSGGGTVNFDGSGPVSPSVINLSSFGTLGGSSVVTVGNTMTWTSGSMSGTGRTVISPGATLTIANPSILTITTRTLDNGGTAIWTGSGSITLNASVITNRAGALFNLQNSSPIFFGGGAPRFDNAGTLRKSVSTGTTTIGDSVPFTNYGLVDIQSGFLAANGGYVSSSNAVLNCALAGTAPGTNYGQLQVSGSVTLKGTLSVNLANNYIPTKNDSFTVVTAGAQSGGFSNFIYPSNQVSMVLSNTTTSVIVQVTNVLAVPQPLLVAPQLSGSNIDLAWTAVSNTTYRVEFNPSLTLTNWTPLPGDVTALSDTASKSDPLTPSNRFYRVLVVP